MHVEGFGRLFPDERGRTCGIHLLGPADREEQGIGLLAGLSIGRKHRLDVALESERQLAKRRPAIKARERQINQKILCPLGSDLCPGLGSRRTLD